MDRWEKGMLAKSLAGHDEGKIYVIINIEEMLPEDIINTINILNNELLKKEKSKGIIDLEIHKEKGDICCPDCKNKSIKKWKI